VVSFPAQVPADTEVQMTARERREIGAIRVIDGLLDGLVRALGVQYTARQPVEHSPKPCGSQ
jgi:hypothetical protein